MTISQPPSLHIILLLSWDLPFYSKQEANHLKRLFTPKCMLLNYDTQFSLNIIYTQRLIFKRRKKRKGPC